MRSFLNVFIIFYKYVGSLQKFLYLCTRLKSKQNFVIQLYKLL